MKIDTALYNNEKRHQLEGYFIVDTILSLSHLHISPLLVYTHYYVFTFVFFWLLLVYLNLVSLSDA